MFATGRERHHASTTAQGAFCRQQGRATKTVITANHQHATEQALVRRGRSSGQTRQIKCIQAFSTHGRLRHDQRIGLQVIENQLANPIHGIAGEQPQLQADKGHRELSPHRNAKGFTGVGAHPGRNIDCHDRQTAGIDRIDRAAVRLSHLTAQARPEQRIDDGAGARE